MEFQFFCWFSAQTRRDEKKIENFLLTTWRDKLNEEINWMISYISKESEPLCGAQSRSIRCYLGFELLPHHPSRNRNGRCNFISIFDCNKFIFNPPFRSSFQTAQFNFRLKFLSTPSSFLRVKRRHRRSIDGSSRNWLSKWKSLKFELTSELNFNWKSL